MCVAEFRRRYYVIKVRHQLGADTRGGVGINEGEAAGDANVFAPHHQVHTERPYAGHIYPRGNQLQVVQA